MNKKGVIWLYRELPEWVSKGILSAENAEKLHEYYGSIQVTSRRKIALIFFSCMGAVLIGSGIILMLAHNWEDLSRPVRTLLALTPLLIAQALAGWLLWRENESVAWREGTAAFLTLSIGIAISLISQTYHISGSMANFLLTWMLLGIPVAYLLRASLPIVLYLAGLTAWAGNVQSEGGPAVGFWLLAALIVPHYWLIFKQDRYSYRSTVLSWALCLCLCIAPGVVLEKAVPGLWIVVYSSLFAIMYFVGRSWFNEAMGFRSRPFLNVGIAGIAVISFLLTYKWPWRDIGWHSHRPGGSYHEIGAYHDYVLAALLLVISIYFLIGCLKRREIDSTLLGFVPVVAAIGFLAAGSWEYPAISRGLFNVYLFVLGMGTTLKGIQNQRLGAANTGMLMLSVLFVARFFDSSIGYVARGIAFIVIGIGFLATNLVIVRQGTTRKGEIQ